MLERLINKVKRIIKRQPSMFKEHEKEALEELFELIEKKLEITATNWVRISKFEGDDFLGTNYPEEIILRNNIIEANRRDKSFIERLLKQIYIKTA